VKYYLEIIEDGHRIPAGKPLGYDTLEEAKQAAEQKIDDALPRNTVRVYAHVTTAHFAGDGSTYCKDHNNGRSYENSMDGSHI
jgi:hypothetical protein